LDATKSSYQDRGQSSFAPETRVIGNPRDRRTGVYHIRPFGWPVIECFVGDEAARMVEETGPAAGFAHAADELADLFGSSVRRRVHPHVASNWG
jgi:monoamine oxidase